MLFWMRLLKDALPAGRPHRSPSSIRQQLCPKNGGAGGPSWLSSSVLNPFIPGRNDATSTQLSELDALRTNGATDGESQQHCGPGPLKIPRLHWITGLGPASRTERECAETADLTRAELPSNSRAHLNNVRRTMKHVLRETGSCGFERPLVGFRRRRTAKLVSLIPIGYRACLSNLTSWSLPLMSWSNASVLPVLSALQMTQTHTLSTLSWNFSD